MSTPVRAARPATATSGPPPAAREARRYDRSIIDGPLAPAVWKIAWPTMLTNIIGGLQGIIDHAMVGNLVGFTGNAAIGVSWQIFIIVIVFISSLFTGMSVLVARFVGAGEQREGGPHRLSGVSHRGRALLRHHRARSAISSRHGCSTS